MSETGTTSGRGRHAAGWAVARGEDVDLAPTPEADDRQLGNRCDKGYPELAGTSPGACVTTSRRCASRCQGVRLDAAVLPFLLVVTSRLVPPCRGGAVRRPRTNRLHRHGRRARRLCPIAEVEPPEADAYLLVDVDTGAGTLGVRPTDALPVLLGAGAARSPSTRGWRW